MLILNADDVGRSHAETDIAVALFREGRLTSGTFMMFMEDTERAVELAREHGMNAGLHLNLSQRYNGRAPSPAAQDAHERVVRFMKSITERPEEKRAERAVGSTWFGPPT